jgi:hypothetical protein
MAPVTKADARAHCVAAHKNSEAEYIECVDLALDAIAGKRFTLRTAARLISFHGTHEQNEHINRLLERLEKAP